MTIRWIWCLHCEKCFQADLPDDYDPSFISKEEAKYGYSPSLPDEIFDIIDECPNEGCDGSPIDWCLWGHFITGRAWGTFAEGMETRHDWPRTPEPGRRYPQYPEDCDCSECREKSKAGASPDQAEVSASPKAIHVLSGLPEVKIVSNDPVFPDDKITWIRYTMTEEERSRLETDDDFVPSILVEDLVEEPKTEVVRVTICNPDGTVYADDYESE